jgi:hypothetical protein
LLARSVCTLNQPRFKSTAVRYLLVTMVKTGGAPGGRSMGLVQVAISVTGLGVGFYFGMIHGEKEATLRTGLLLSPSYDDSATSMSAPKQGPEETKQAKQIKDQGKVSGGGGAPLVGSKVCTDTCAKDAWDMRSAPSRLMRMTCRLSSDSHLPSFPDPGRILPPTWTLSNDAPFPLSLLTPLIPGFQWCV